MKWNSKGLQESVLTGQTRSLKASVLLHSTLRSKLSHKNGVLRSESASSSERSQTFRKSNEDIQKKIKRAADRKKTQALF
jgi:hypothetical protein